MHQSRLLVWCRSHKRLEGCSECRHTCHASSATQQSLRAGNTVRNGRTIVAGGGHGGSQSIQPAGSAKAEGTKQKKASKISGALKAPLSRVSCGLGRSFIGMGVLDDSIHAADMVYRMTGTTGSLVYMAPEVFLLTPTRPSSCSLLCYMLLHVLLSGHVNSSPPCTCCRVPRQPPSLKRRRDW